MNYILDNIYENWDMYYVSANNNIKFNDIFINFNNPLLKWDIYGINSNPNLNIDIIQQNPNFNWNWYKISDNNMKLGRELFIREISNIYYRNYILQLSRQKKGIDALIKDKFNKLL
jgi:hypothetical protein